MDYDNHDHWPPRQLRNLRGSHFRRDSIVHLKAQENFQEVGVGIGSLLTTWTFLQYSAENLPRTTESVTVLGRLNSSLQDMASDRLSQNQVITVLLSTLATLATLVCEQILKCLMDKPPDCLMRLFRVEPLMPQPSPHDRRCEQPPAVAMVSENCWKERCYRFRCPASMHTLECLHL